MLCNSTEKMDEMKTENNFFCLLLLSCFIRKLDLQKQNPKKKQKEKQQKKTGKLLFIYRCLLFLEYSRFQKFNE